MLHNQFEVLNRIDTDSVVENTCSVTEQNIQSCDKISVCKTLDRVNAQLGGSLHLSLNGRSKTVWWGENETGCLNGDHIYTK